MLAQAAPELFGRDGQLLEHKAGGIVDGVADGRADGRGGALAGLLRAERALGVVLGADEGLYLRQKYAKPTIPLGLLHDIEELEPGGSYDQANGGQWKPTKPTSNTFKGVVMPVNNEDLQYAIAGTYTQNSQKLYTNGHSLTVGQQVRDTFDGQVYTVKQLLQGGLRVSGGLLSA